MEEDWRGLSSAAFADRLAGYLASDRSRGFELTRAPLMRALLVRETEVGWRLVLSHHHLLLDGWSAALLFDELAERYRALVSGTVPELPQRRPYRDFLAWLAAQDPAAAERYWRAALADAPATGVPLGSAVDAGPRRMSEAEGLVAAPLWAEVQALGRSLGVTAASIAAAAWGIVLARATGEEDVVFGTTVSGRPEGLAGSEVMIGLFINTVPLRVRAASGARLGAYLAAVQQGLIQAREHGHVPLAKIQGWAGARRAAFETLLVYENYPAAQAAAGSALGVTAATSHEETNYPAALILEPEAEGLRIRLHHDLARLGQGDAARLVARFVQLLAAMAAQGATARLCALDHRTPEDRAASAALARVRIDAGVPVPLLPDLFLAAAARHPAAPALHCGAQTMDYAALRSRALAVAHQLAARGARPGAIVAIALERGPMLLPVLLGTMLAGCAYLPLDHTHPAARLAGLCRDLGVAILVHDGEAPPFAVPCPGLAVADIPAETPMPVLPTIDPGAIAYVIATSGSTGTPKPVAISHRALAGFLAWAVAAYPAAAFARVAATTPVTFDVSVFELFAPLAAGGAVLLLDHLAMLDGADAPSLVSGVPSLIAATALPPSPFLNLAGEALPQDLADRLRASMPSRVLRNLYGPTEATVYATMATLAPGAAVTIGQPLPMLAAYVLGPALQPVAPGEPGELYLAGPSLAIGYLGIPGRTARAFLPDPFGPPGTRMYRTGDLVCIGDDGALRFLGRRDGQIKLAGVRIELGEVEAAMRAHGYAEAVAVMVRGTEGQPSIVACTTRPFDPKVLEDRLPATMIPTAAIQVDAIPRTASGKVDRARLTALAATARSRVLPSDAAAANACEAGIAQAMAATLGLPHVGPEDDFLALGGDSIIAMQAAAAARKAGLAVGPRAFVTQRTARAIARSIGGPSVDTASAPLQENVPLGAIQTRFFAEGRRNPDHFNQALLFALDPDTDVAALQAALNAVEAAHAALRFRYSGHGPAVVQRVVPPRGVPLETIMLPADADPAAAITAACARLQTGLNLATGPVFRAALFPGAPARLFLAVHHLCIDGVSWRILLDDLATAYAQARAGRPIALPAPSAAFGAWAQAAHRFARAPERAADWERWLSAAAAPRAALPRDALQPEAAGDAVLTRRLDAAVTQRLLREAPARHAVGINAILLGALGQLLCDWAGGPVVVDLEGHGREPLGSGLDLSRTIGWFTSLFPVRLAVPPAASLAAAVAAAAQALDLPDAGVGYGVLRYLSGDPRGSALAGASGEVLFNYLGQLDGLVSAAPVAGWSPEPVGADEAADEPRSHVLEVNAMVSEGCLSIAWRYDPQRHREATIADLADRFCAACTRIVEAEGSTAGVDDAVRDRVLARLAGRQG
ncbi:non-ribosomal peptide synthetase [Sphingomonas pokkalii]|uniref:Carrier domain-containing protein n=2 Tax=Sphingomonas pokkalii TaxID=2175090 RepID=A0A2U0S995_9SPHN|nr:non-ribosomal peptide synthetase [Sphingomonas pokkalii]PVX27920.1 hypothetical protein DD559_19340 [Sphingomonas pokkalii]